MYIMIQKCSLWQVLSVFFDEPLKIHYIKEIARKIDLAPTSVKNHLNKLLKENLVLKRKGERFVGFISNRENEGFLFYKKIDNLMKLRESGLLSHLIESFYPEVIISYGSYVKGEDVEGSDIDIFILTKVKKQLNLKKFENILKRDIHIIMESDLERLAKALRSEIINGSILYGYLNISK